MKVLDYDDLLALVSGAAIYSAGGGGAPQVGCRIVDRLVSQGHAVNIIPPSDVPKDAKVVNFACVGATTTLEYDSEAAVRTLKVLEDYVGFQAYAAIPVELGGFNTLAAVDVAARRSIPVVDGDGAGRSVPEVHLKVYTIDNIPLAPMVIADTHARNIVIVRETEDLKACERIARSLAAEWNHSAYTARRILTGAQVKTSPIQLSLSKCIQIGRLLKESANPLDAILEATGGFKLFEGVVKHVQRKTQTGFTFVTARLGGTGEHTGSVFTLKAKNEVLVAYRDQKLAAIAPDIITPADPGTGTCVTAETIETGDRLAVLGIPSPGKWRSSKGLGLWKDVLQRSQIFEDYVAVEKLAFGMGIRS